MGKNVFAERLLTFTRSGEIPWVEGEYFDGSLSNPYQYTNNTHTFVVGWREFCVGKKLIKFRRRLIWKRKFATDYVIEVLTNDGKDVTEENGKLVERLYHAIEVYDSNQTRQESIRRRREALASLEK